MFSLTKKVAVVTGARQGIGLGISQMLAQAGAFVVMADLDEAATRKAAGQVVKKTKSKTAVWSADVSRHAEVERLADFTLERFGRLDIWVNNAGVYPFRPLLQMSESDWDHVLDVNLKGCFFGTQAAAKRMVREKTGGRIVNISSIAALVGYAGLTHYCASKAGIAGFTRAAALELAPFGINVNAIAPGPIQTPGVGAVDQKMLSQIVATVPKKRMGKPEDIASAALYLSSNESDFVTGQVIVVDGGSTIQ